MINRKTRSVAFGIARRGIRILATNPSIFLPSVIFPLFFLATFAGGLSRIGTIPGFDFAAGFTAFEYIFVLLQAVSFAGVFTGFAIARDFDSGFARRLLLAAPNRRGIVVGYALTSLARATVSVTVVTIAALLGGMNVLGSGIDMLALVGLAILMNLSATLWSTGIAMRFRTIQSGPLMQIPVFLVLFMAPVYVPRALLQNWIEAVASVNPTTYVLEAGRSLISGSPSEVGIAYVLAAAMVVLFTVWALRGLRKAEQQA